MSNSRAFKIDSLALSDRGLNERRPLNEDSYLADRERSIFAVADGVGGAEAGEVASQTAIEVLDEAFRHQTNGADVEDLMELAIQRANASIHQMAQDHARFSMMATTIVALHVEGNVATFGHVGDSRLYRLAPDGKLHRETLDHSIVEEEVRAGRMTPEQAANHPSKNVISRALGAEQDVEVDMKTIEVEEGTEFLLCTDGITRHISDNELRQLLVINDDLEATCAELKRRCYERGAEDNLTVVIVRVGQHIAAGRRQEDLEPTISPETQPIFMPTSNESSATTSNVTPLIPPSRIAFPDPGDQTTPVQERLNVASPDEKKGGSSGVAKFFYFVLILALIGGAFYAGARFKDRLPPLPGIAKPVQTPVPQPTPKEEPFVQFEKTRRQLDQDPRAWLASDIGKELLASGVQNPLDSPNPEFLYLYGRASLLTGNPDEAAKAFEVAITKTELSPSPANVTIKKEAILALSAVTLKTQKEREKALLHYDELTRPASGTATP
jgi:serine/threonine protein phosphatase PrpC